MAQGGYSGPLSWSVPHPLHSSLSTRPSLSLSCSQPPPSSPFWEALCRHLAPTFYQLTGTKPRRKTPTTPTKPKIPAEAKFLTLPSLLVVLMKGYATWADTQEQHSREWVRVSRVVTLACRHWNQSPKREGVIQGEGPIQAISCGTQTSNFVNWIRLRYLMIGFLARGPLSSQGSRWSIIVVGQLCR